MRRWVIRLLAVALSILIVSLVFFRTSIAVADNHCEPLKPTEEGIVSEEFKGKIEGELKGLASRIAGAGASISGEYKRFEESRLQELPDSQRLYVWQRTLYLACVDPESGIDLNRLLELYLIDPARLTNDGEAKGSRSYFSGDSVYLDGKIQAVISNARMTDGGRSMRVTLALRNISDRPVLIALHAHEPKFATTDMGDIFGSIEVSGIKRIGSLRRDTFETASNYSRVAPNEDVFMIWDIELDRGEEKILGTVVNLNSTIIYLEGERFVFTDFHAPSIAIPH